MAANRNAISTRQVDWNCDDQSSPEYIKNKPTTKPVVAGDNVSIEETDENFKISASGGGSAPEYVAGDGITISGDTISVNTDAIQTKLTAGNNIEINSGIISTGKSVVAAGSNVSVESSLDSVTNTVTYTVSGIPSGGGGTVKYSIDRSKTLTWNESSNYASGVFYFNDGGDNSGIEYYLDNEDNIMGYQLVQGHVYQLNFNLNITHGNATGKLIKGHIYATGPIDQNWYFQVDGSQSEDLSFTGSTIVHCSTSSTGLVFSAKIPENLNGSYPSLAFSQISIVDLTALTGAN